MLSRVSSVFGTSLRRGYATGASKVLVVAEHDNKALKQSTLNAISAAKQLGGEITVLVAGQGSASVAESVAKVNDVKAVLHADSAIFQHSLPEPLSPLIARVAKGGFSHVLAPATAFGKNVLPRAAALLDTQAIGDVVSIKSADTFVRPIYAGNAVSTVQSSDSVKVVTVRISAFDKAASGEGKASITALKEEAAETDAAKLSSFKSAETATSERPELSSARIIISGGRALGAADKFKILEELGDALGGAAIGASRAAVDAGYATNDMQIGQTGKIVAPGLYIAVGISGAIQHLAGMKDSKTIVAINKDPEAPIFQVADYGLVADLFDAVPKLTKLVKESK